MGASAAVLSLDAVAHNDLVNQFIIAANEYLGAVGYTEHGMRHVSQVAATARDILERLGHAHPLPELAAVAGYMHDIGNVVNRQDHGQSAALIAMRILGQMGGDPGQIALVISAIGNHEEEIGDPVNPVAAALILADKADVHKSRVRSPDQICTDIHDRVNYAAERSTLRVEPDRRAVVLDLTIDTAVSQVMEYFEIFMSRMVMCRRAAQFLGCSFELIINERKLL